MRTRRLAIAALLLAGMLSGEEKKNEPAIADQLKSKDPAHRERAAERLGEQGDKAAAKLLLPLLADPDWGVRLAATRAVAPIRSTKVREALIVQLRTGATSVIRLRTAELLRKIDDAMLPPEVAKDLGRIKGEGRVRIIEALGILGTPSGAEAVAKQMRSSEVEVRIAAARALGKLRMRIGALLAGLKDKEDEVRWLCAVGIAGIDSNTGREALIRWIEKANPRKPVPGYVLRRIGRKGAKINAEQWALAIAKALPGSKQARALLLIAWHGKLAGCATAAREHLRAREAQSRALALCVAGLGKESLTAADVKSALNHKHPVVRHAAASAYLQAAKDPRAALEQVLRSKHENVVLEAVRFAAQSKRKDAIPLLIELAKGKTAAKKALVGRAAACVALGRLARADAFADLIELAQDRTWQVRAAALEGMIYCWKKEAIPVYLQYFRDRSSVVRKVVRNNLGYMTRKRFTKRAPYEKWWKEIGPKYNLVHPDDVRKRVEAERDKYGYAVQPRRYIQSILGGTEILVIRGRWDFVEKVLVDLEVKHTAVFAQKVKDLGVTPKQVVLVNCEGTTDSETADYLRWFVATGGYMAVTDWALVNALVRTFPSVIAKYAKRNTGNDVVVVEPGTPDSKLLDGAFPAGVRPKWWLEIQAFPITIDDPVRANVLVDSFEMLSRYGSSPMLVEFSAGLGRVIHSTSHFFLAKEGFSNFGSAEERKLFAADHLGLPMREIRELEKSGFFDQMKETTPISRSYSMFVMLVNFIREKQAIDVNLR
ncbi:MAG: HEAT repeat domain-containing protein [Planctomycetota bacterium]|jgi:HEAT repeat protein